jgi:hypothetical protein
MANLIQLPMAQNLPSFTFTTTLSSVAYTFNAYFNTRAERWMLDILDVTLTPILVGLPLLIDRDLLAQYATLPLPPGGLFVIDESGKQAQPNAGSFLIDHTLLYLEP